MMRSKDRLEERDEKKFLSRMNPEAFKKKPMGQKTLLRFFVYGPTVLSLFGMALYSSVFQDQTLFLIAVIWSIGAEGLWYGKKLLQNQFYQFALSYDRIGLLLKRKAAERNAPLTSKTNLQNLGSLAYENWPYGKLKTYHERLKSALNKAVNLYQIMDITIYIGLSFAWFFTGLGFLFLTTNKVIIRPEWIKIFANWGQFLGFAVMAYFIVQARIIKIALER